VTLIERPVWETLGDHHGADEKVWGMAYRIPKDKVESVKEYVYTGLFAGIGGANEFL